MKILEAIERGKANLCSEPVKETALALNSNKHALVDAKGQMKVANNNGNVQNIFIQKELNKVNKIQVFMGNRPVDVLQEEYKSSFSSSSFYKNGMPTIKIEREGEARRLFSPTDKLTRFEEVKIR